MKNVAKSGRKASRQSTFLVTVIVTPGSTTRDAARAIRSVLRESGIDPASDVFSRPTVKFAGIKAGSTPRLLPRSARTASRASAGTLLAENRRNCPKAPRGAGQSDWAEELARMAY